MIKVKLTRFQLEELYKRYNEGCWAEFSCYSDLHNILLREHWIEFRAMLSICLCNKIANKFTITFTGTSALAFYQSWNAINTQREPVITAIVGGIIEHIDKANEAAYNTALLMR